jgi:undecaprenyl-diphosphatase
MNLLFSFDLQVSLFLNSFHNKFLDLFSLGISWITEGGFIWIILCFFIFIFDKKQKKRKILLLLLALLLSDWIVNIPFKLVLFCRPRPYQVLKGIRVIGKVWENCSFPSGHLATSSAALLIIWYLYNLNKKWFIFPSAIFILLLGFARIYVGMHYLTDVLGGIIIGIFSAFFIIYLDSQVTWRVDT